MNRFFRFVNSKQAYLRKGLQYVAMNLQNPMKADELFPTAVDLVKSMPHELSWSPPAKKNGFWIFWSQQNDELSSLDPVVHDHEYSEPANGILRENIKAVLRRLPKHCFVSTYLFLFWARIRMGNKIYLTIADQPFGLTRLHKGLCSYRKLVSRLLIRVDPNMVVDEKEPHLSPIQRVFRTGLHELCHNVRHYLTEEYLLRGYAIEFGVKTYFALPLFEMVEKECIGVLEILSTSGYDSGNIVYDCFLGGLKELGVAWDAPHPYGSSIQNLKDPIAAGEACQLMEDMSMSHQLPSIQMWIANSTTNCIYGYFGYHRSPYEMPGCKSIFGMSVIGVGEGVPGKAFLSRSACFCNNVSKLSIGVYHLVQIAREFGLSGCFAVCLGSLEFDEFYILEFFLPRIKDYGDPRTFLTKLVTMLRAKIELSSHLQKLEKTLFVEVIKISSSDELDSFEIGMNMHPEGRENKQQPIKQTSLQKPTMELDAIIKDYNFAREEQSEFFLGGLTRRRPLESTSSNSLYGGNEATQEVGTGIRLDASNDDQSYSVIQSSAQEMSLRVDLNLNHGHGIQNYPMDEPRLQFPVHYRSLGLHLGMVRRRKVEDDSEISSSVGNYSVAEPRFMVSSESQSGDNSDSDFMDINAFTQILRRDKNYRFYGVDN